MIKGIYNTIDIIPVINKIIRTESTIFGHNLRYYNIYL